MNRAMIRSNCLPARLLGLLVASASLAACASAGDYPSLARRDAERIAGEETIEPAVPPPAPATPGMASRLAELVELARNAHHRFSARQGSAEQRTAAGAGSATGSEAWAVASIALADLEAVRSEAMIALAELDGLHAADRVANPNQPSSDAPAIAAARDQVMAWIAEQDRVLARLRGRIR